MKWAMAQPSDKVTRDDSEHVLCNHIVENNSTLAANTSSPKLSSAQEGLSLVTHK